MFGKTLIVSVIAISGLISVPGHVLSTLPGDRHEVRLVSLHLNAEEGSSDRIVHLMVRGFRSLILQLEALVGGVIDGTLVYQLWQASLQGAYVIDASNRLRMPATQTLASYPEWPAEGMEIRVVQVLPSTPDSVSAS